MAFQGLQIDLDSRSSGELRLGVDLASLGQQNVTTEDQSTTLFEALRGSVFSYLLSVFGLRSALEAEDITQDAFLQMHRSLQKGHFIENPRAWLFRVAHNLAIDRIKVRQFIAPLDDLEWEELCGRLPDPGISPEQRTQRLEDFARVLQAMGRLSVQERQCLHLRTEGLRYKEIGDILGISAAAVGKYLRRAIKKLMIENLDFHSTE